MDKKKPKLIYKRWGLANYFPDHIELNRDLKKDKHLKRYVLRHELNHKSKFDLQHDLSDINKQTFRLIRFVLFHPRTWIDFLPIQIQKNKIVYDANLIMLYLLCLVLLIILISLF